MRHTHHHHHWGDEPRMRGRRGGPRGRGPGRRGKVRAAVLALLAEQPRHGYEIITAIAERSEGAWEPSPGSIYPALSMLADEGLIAATEEGGKKTYHLTDAGRVCVSENADDLDEPWAQMGHPHTEAHELRRHDRALHMAIRQVAMTGTPQQQADTLALLKEAKAGIYTLLAEEDD